VINDIIGDRRPQQRIDRIIREPCFCIAAHRIVGKLKRYDISIHGIAINLLVIFAYELGCFFISGIRIYLPETVSIYLIFTDAAGMAHEQVAVPAPEKIHELVIRQPWLNRDLRKIAAIKFLDAVRETDPAEIMFVKCDLTDGGLQEAFIYVIAERIVPLYLLCMNRREQDRYQ
jgi:hypothetical protein